LIYAYLGVAIRENGSTRAVMIRPLLNFGAIYSDEILRGDKRMFAKTNQHDEKRFAVLRGFYI